jgi:hypothetical protein
MPSSLLGMFHHNNKLTFSIAVSNLHKQTKKQFSQVIQDLYTYVNPKNNKPSPMISKATYEIIMAHAEELDSAIIYDKDFNYNYFGFKTMEVYPFNANLIKAILPLENQRQSCRETTTHDHASRSRYSRQ